MRSKKVTIGHPILNDETGEKGVLLIGPEVDVVDEALKELYKLREENEYLKKVNDEKTKIGVADHKYASQKEDESIKYKASIDKAIDKIQYIIDYGFDYDGFSSSKDLKALIDMLVDYAVQAKNILQGRDNNV